MPQAKLLVKLVQKLLEIHFFPICGIRGRTGKPNYLVGMIFSKRGKFKLLVYQGDPLPQFSSLVRHPNLPIRKILKGAWSAYCIILERVSESIFFQSNKLRACKVKDEKEVANSLITFNLLKIIHPFQGKEVFEDLVKLADHNNIKLATNRFKHKFFYVTTQLSVTIILLYFT